MTRLHNYHIRNHYHRQTFKVFDKNNDGFITADELKQVIESFGHNLTDEELDEMLEGVDKNKDGKINYLEFLEMARWGVHKRNSCNDKLASLPLIKADFSQC